MSNIIAQAGDTFERISRRAYGTDSGAAQIERANPGVTEPIPVGASLVIPPQLNAPRDKPPTSPHADLDEITLSVGGELFRFWGNIKINRALDSAPSVSFESVWEPANEQMRRVFKPFSYQPCEVAIGGERLFTGTMLTPGPDVSENSATVAISAYGLTGVLSDCPVPASAHPLEYSPDQTLDTIARSLLEPFGIAVRYEAEKGAEFEQVGLEVGDEVMPFLVKLAKQRNTIIGETVDGEARFYTPATDGAPVADLVEGHAPLTSISAVFADQGVYSHVTGIAPSYVSETGEQHTIPNPYLRGVVRPYVFDVDDSKGLSLPEAVRAKASRMFGSMIKWAATVPTLRTSTGKLWAEGDIVTVTAPGAMIYNKTELLIRRVVFDANEESRVASLELVLPGVFSGKIPEGLPWDE